MGFFDLFKSKRSLRESGVLNGSSDRHSHILYGVDDGIKTLEDALAALDFEASLGVRNLWCTPHIMEDVPNRTDNLKKRFDELCAAYQGPIKLHLAAEYMMDTLFEERLREKDILTMDEEMCLMETSTVAPPYDLKGMLYDAMSAGYRPVFAHPERCRFMQVRDCEELVRMGVRLQLNVASLTGYYGDAAQTKAETLLKQGLYYMYGSDCHRVATIKEQYSRPVISDDIINKLSSIACV